MSCPHTKIVDNGKILGEFNKRSVTKDSKFYWSYAITLLNMRQANINKIWCGSFIMHGIGILIDNVTENVYRLISFRLQRHEDNKLPDACLIHTRNTPITGPTIKT